jgi:predicted nucleic acid-binding protein
MTYLVDSDWIIDALHGIPDALAALEQNAGAGLATSIITFGEVYDGAYGYPNPEEHLSSFRQFLTGYEVIGLDDAVMEFFARTRSRLRREGNIVADLDLLIGATAVVNGFTLMTRNLRHCHRIPELDLYVPH